MTSNGRVHIARFLLLLTAGLLLSGCANQPLPEDGDAPGFFLGLFHGFTILFSLIGSLFTEHRIYAYPNSGFLYDLGYLFGVMMFLGGGAEAKRKKRVPEPNQED